MRLSSRALRLCAAFLLLAFVSLGLWESIGHGFEIIPCERTATLSCLSGQSLLNPENSRHQHEHDAATCPICAAAGSSVGCIANPTMVESQVVFTFITPCVYTYKDTIPYSLPSNRAPPAA